MEFSRKEYWSKFPVPFPGELFYPGMESRSPTLQADSLPSEPAGNSLMQWLHNVKEGWEPKNRYFWTNLSQPMLSSVQSVMPNSLPPHGLQHNRPPCPSPTLWSLLKLMSIKSVMPSNNLILCHPLLLSSIFPSIRVFSLMNQFFASGGQSIGVSVLASVLPMNIQFDFLKDRLIWSPCSPRDSQESSQTQKFKSINSSVLSLLYDPSLTSLHDYWKNHSFD